MIQDGQDPAIISTLQAGNRRKGRGGGHSLLPLKRSLQQLHAARWMGGHTQMQGRQGIAVLHLHGSVPAETGGSVLRERGRNR